MAVMYAYKGPETRGAISKRPNEVKLVKIAMGPYLNGRTTVSSCVTTVSGTGTPPTVAQQTIVGNTVPVKISAGADAFVGVLKLMITCADTEVLEVEYDLTISVDTPKSGTLRKQPSETRIERFDIGRILDGSTTVSSVTQAILPALNAPTVTLPALEAGDVQPIKLAAGTTGYAGVLTLTVTCANTEVFEFPFAVTVKEL